jgi:uncharacterized membrane protein
VNSTLATCLPLASAFGYAVAALILKRATEGGAGPWRIGFVVNLVMALLFQCFWFFSPGGRPIELLDVGYACLVGAIFFTGQFFTFLALSKGDVSVTTPVLGAKVLFVAFFAALILHQPLDSSLWIATIMTCVAMALLGGEWRTDRERILPSLVYGGLSALSFATSDILLKNWVGGIGMTRFAPITFGSMAVYSLLLRGRFSAPLSALGTRTLAWAMAGGALLWLQCAGMVLAISLANEVTRTNILYNTRGIWSVLLVWAIGPWFGNQERTVGRKIMFLRLLGAILLLAAVFLAPSRN